MNYAVYDAPFGKLSIVFDDKQTLHTITTSPPTGMAQQKLPASWQEKLDGYFAGGLKEFACPPASDGTLFQRAVWREIARIPYGCTTTYGEIATVLASHPRAVGQACGKNPLPIVIPCHRVLAKNGLLGGFSLGDGDNRLAIKRFLLRLEGVLP